MTSPDTAPPSLDPLRTLLRELFDAGELRRLMRDLSLAEYLPENASLVDLADHASALLLRHGRIDAELFFTLCRQRPAREREILAVQARYLRAPRAYPLRPFIKRTLLGLRDPERRPFPGTHVAVCVGQVVDGRPRPRPQYDGQESDAEILDPEAFPTLQSLLDHIYDAYLAGLTEPHRYGVDWALAELPARASPPPAARRLLLPPDWLAGAAPRAWPDTWRDTSPTAAGLAPGGVYCLLPLHPASPVPDGGAPEQRGRSAVSTQFFALSPHLAPLLSRPKDLASWVSLGRLKLVPIGDLDRRENLHTYVASREGHLFPASDGTRYAVLEKSNIFSGPRRPPGGGRSPAK